jgi:hypothetical protein
MFKTHEIQQGRKTVTALELTLFAFTTPKGTFTLSGTNTDGTDTWHNINTGEFHEWQRASIKTWWEQGKITPIEEATTVIWQETNGNSTAIDYNTKTIHRHHKK